jgi:predicted MPP superfamily phosphohydrolase
LRTLTRLPRRLAYGLHEIGGRHLYVSGGVGTTVLPIRFWRPPEIALLTLGAPA